MEAPEFLKVDSVRPDPALLERAAGALRRGTLVAFPTETFYGLGAAALDAAAVRRIFDVKARPPSRPLLVLVASSAMAETIADVTPTARTFMDRHWPGALTLVLRAGPRVPAEVTAGTGTVGVRLSSHAVARALVEALGGPITAPSANPTGEPPPTTARDVVRYFDGALALVLDAGPTPGGLASTVLDVTGDAPRVIRQGAVRVNLS